MDNGFIRLHRKFLNWEWYRHPNTKLLFIHLLLSANWKKTKWHGIDLYPGELIRTDENLSKEIGITKRQVRSSFLSLRKSGEVSMRYEAGSRIITIKNWKKYQTNVTAPVTQTVTTRSPKVSTDEEVKNVKNVRSVYANTPPAREEVEDYCRQVGYLSIDVGKFMDYNSAKGWTMDWKKALDLWYRKDHGSRSSSGNKFGNIMTHDYDFEALEKALVGGE